LIRFDPIGHIYRLENGTRIPSVTQALSIVERGFEFVAPEILDRAREFGRNVHLATHLFDRGTLNEPRLDPELAPYLAQYKQFLFDTKARVIASEEIVYCEQMRYAGQLDKRLAWKRSTYLCDLKSGAVPHTVGPQTAAYQRASIYAPRKRICLQLKRDTYRLIVQDDLSDFSLFISALNCYRFTQRGRMYGIIEEEAGAAAAGNAT
jgi:hypothetical protein